MINTKEIKKIIPQWLLEIAIIFFIVSLISLGLIFALEKKYQGKIYPNIWLGSIDLGGITKAQAKTLLNTKINSINQAGITFYYDEAQASLMPTITSTEGDFAYQLIDFEVNQTVDEAYTIGRNNNFIINLQNKILNILFKKHISLKINLNEKEIEKILKESFSQFETPAYNAKLIKNEDGNFSVSKEQYGIIIQYNPAIMQLGANLKNLNDSAIELFAVNKTPLIYQKDCLNIDAKAKQTLALAPFKLIYEGQEWEIDQAILASWLSLKTNPNPTKEDKIIIGLDESIVSNYLEDEIASTTDQPPVDAKFEIKDGRVIEFQGSYDGFELNINESYKSIESYLLTSKNYDTQDKNLEIDLIKTDLKSKVLTQDINDFGIEQIIGTGESNFSGSPANRRHNIKNGANTLNGVLIKPDEEFSLNNALGEINAETGYLSELVIKGNQTIAEYGGGLCQIGTTMFRAALATGLEITQRRNHSYRVRYYEPAGTDATIYDPWPDLKFINNTGSYILIQSRIEGDNLYFDFWGKDDGRVVEQSEPSIYNIIRPGPTKLIETLDLEPGKKRCTEHAVNGADAHFDYKVTYANGEVYEKIFTSHYVPWQEVCLIGVEELTATSTEKIIK